MFEKEGSPVYKLGTIKERLLKDGNRIEQLI